MIIDQVKNFRIARAVKKPEQGESTTVFDPARLGALTPAYASLEIIRGTSPDPRDHVRQLALPDSTALLETPKVLREGHQMQLNQVKKAEVQRLAEISKRKAQVEKMLNLSPLTAKASCATQDADREFAGAGFGATVGAGIAVLAGGDTKTIIASAAGAAVAGWAIAKLANYRSNKTRTPEKDKDIYGVTEQATKTLVKIRRGSSFPETVNPGDFVNVVTDYSIVAPEGTESVDVQESWQLKKDGKKLAEIDPQHNRRSVGGWATKARIQIPREAETGSYVIEHKVKVESSQDDDQSVFVVQ